MERNFKMYCKEVSNDGSEFKLVLEINNEVKEEKTSIWSFDDVLIDAYDFFRENLEKYNFDSRRDKLKVNLSYEL